MLLLKERIVERLDLCFWKGMKSEMGFLDALSKVLGLDTENEISPIETKKDNNELEGSIVLELAKMKQKIIAMEIHYPEKAEEIKQKIQELESYIENSVEMNFETQTHINELYDEIKREFSQFSKVSEEKFLLSEVRFIYKELTKIFYGEENSEQEINKRYINELEDKLNILDDRKKEFDGLKQQQYIQDIINAKYRLRCCKMMSGILSINAFATAPEVERIFYANIFAEDIKKMGSMINRIKFKYSLKELEISLEEHEEKIDKIINQIGNAYTEERERLITDVFDEDYIMRLYVETMKVLRDKITFLDRDTEKLKQEIEEKQRQEEAEKKRQEELEKERKTYKGLTEEQQKEKIKQIDESNFDPIENYKNILSYELDVAKEKGLLTNRSLLKTEGSQVIRVNKNKLYSMMMELKKQNIQFGILTDEEQSNNFLILPSGIDWKDIERSSRVSQNIGGEPYSTRNIEGKVGLGFMQLCNQLPEEYFDRGQIGINTNGALYYADYYCEDRATEKIYNIYKKIEQMASEENDIKDIKFYLEIPYKRPICPILEQLKQAGIEYYLLSDDEVTRKEKMTKKIYIDRKNLEKYREKIHSQISNQEKGKVIIGLENVNLKDWAFEGTDVPFIKEIEEKRLKEQEAKKAKEKKEEQEKLAREEGKKQYASLSEQEQRQQIKKIDDKSFDVTQSYKDILQFEKEVGEAKGLLDGKSEMATDDISFMRVKRGEIYEYLVNAREKGIRITILPDVDDEKDSTLIAITKGKTIRKDMKFEADGYDVYLNNSQKLLDIKFSKAFAIYLQKNNTDRSVQISDKLYPFLHEDRNLTGNRTEARYLIGNTYVKLLQEKRETQVPEMKFYIEIPYLRPMLPILEVLKKEGIEYYIPPIDGKTLKYNETKKIYIDVENLEKYKEKVHEQISNGQKGLVIVGDKGLSEADLILGDCKKDIERLREEKEL